MDHTYSKTNKEYGSPQKHKVLMGNHKFIIDSKLKVVGILCKEAFACSFAPM